MAALEASQFHVIRFYAKGSGESVDEGWHVEMETDDQDEAVAAFDAACSEYLDDPIELRGYWGLVARKGGAARG